MAQYGLSLQPLRDDALRVMTAIAQVSGRSILPTRVVLRGSCGCPWDGPEFGAAPAPSHLALLRQRLADAPKFWKGTRD